MIKAFLQRTSIESIFQGCQSVKDQTFCQLRQFPVRSYLLCRLEAIESLRTTQNICGTRQCSFVVEIITINVLLKWFEEQKKNLC